MGAYFSTFKAGQGVKDYDVNTMATRQEMRSYVCGQCHVEYYFAGQEKQLVYPWAKGLQVENILAYYDEAQFKDWMHAETGAPVLKAQHPEFELWNQGIHARSGVACADCHMPYMLRNLAMDALMDLNQDLTAARAAGRTDEQLAAARDFQRKAQFYLDFIEAENSMGFHAPQEAARILGEFINFSRKGERALRTLE